jgi:hypothetical protein
MKNKLTNSEREKLVQAAYGVKKNTLTFSDTNILLELISKALKGSDIRETCKFMGIAETTYTQIFNQLNRN